MLRKKRKTVKLLHELLVPLDDTTTDSFNYLVVRVGRAKASARAHNQHNYIIIFGGGGYPFYIYRFASKEVLRRPKGKDMPLDPY